MFLPYSDESVAVEQFVTEQAPFLFEDVVQVET